ncbi:MAG TPA: alanine racemase [Spirochaetota bacterium]|nr:alanine racemase [Spirochaetota bacterium]
MMQHTHIEIDCTAIGNNLRNIRGKAGADVKILLAIKADGYGHGAVPIARYVERHNLADMFGVSSPAEGVELRNAGITMPVLVLGLILPDSETIDTLLEHSLTQTVADYSLAVSINERARLHGTTALLHLKVDTGMGRIGCPSGNAPDIAEKISSLGHTSLDGLFTHFPVSDDPASQFTKRQIRLFSEIIDDILARGIDVPLRHAANSAAILNFDDSYFTMIRPGVMAYGYMPSPESRRSIAITPSMTLKSHIVFVKNVPAGTGISYGLTHTTERDTCIVTVPVGYGDGYSRFLSNRGRVLIRGKEYPVAGKVCMDQILVDTGNDCYPVGEEVVLFGKDIITAETIASMIGTIPYEVTCGMSKRVPRIYINDD